MPESAEYILAIEQALIESPVVTEFSVVRHLNFPHHCHVASEANVVPSEPTALLTVLLLIRHALESEAKGE